MLFQVLKSNVMPLFQEAYQACPGVKSCSGRDFLVPTEEVVEMRKRQSEEGA